MAERPPSSALDVLLSEPPRRAFVNDDATLRYEHLVMVGWVEAAPWQKDTLDLYGIDLTFARHSSDTGRWEPCLFSLEVAALLASLRRDNDFPFPYDARLSRAGSRWIEAKAAGRRLESQRLSAYLEPADDSGG